ncbi:hypothetical protein M422DRAFT_174167 [Sphaerobolus stellatus SS14]|uniref:Uncharacterized protein n=1 Tax=Sphaerobolus stellatus (strain SS14) TaxID=990650 RepID=A0A0C9VPT9_SPHS4|nr:hypothetical protein M422DRAFT_174167 [Sphaerobolus stellatus SS14]
MPKANISKEPTASKAASTLPSPPSPHISLPTLTRLIVWPIHKRRTSASSADGANKPITPPPSPPSLPSTPSKTPSSPSKTPSTPRSRVAKEQLLTCSSGAEAKTHDLIVDSNPECRNTAVIVYRDVSECRDGVDVQRLLRLSRAKVMQRVEKLGGNTIVHEKWSCLITKHPSKQTTAYRVSITYEGTPARSDLPDPGQPIALDQVKGIPGLMTVVSHQYRYEGPCTKLVA